MSRTLGVLILLSACGGNVPADMELAESSAPIINGAACEETASPEAVAILPRMTVRRGGEEETIDTIDTVTCTGTLIAPDVVMAAGHCVDRMVYAYNLAQQGLALNTIEFYISFKSDLSSMTSGFGGSMPDDAVRVTGYKIHPKYSLQATGWGPQKTNDISVLFLEESQSAQPAVVITHEEAEQLAVNSEVEIVGWGQQTASTQPKPGTFGEKMCATSFVNQLGDWEMQIGSNSGSSRKCHGDSGGPSFMNVETDYTTKRRVVGITSHAYDQSDCLKGGVDTRVDAYLDWLDDTLSSACEDGFRVWCDEPGLISPAYYEPPAPEPSAGSGGDGDRNAKPSRCSTGAISWVSLAGLALLRRRSRATARG